MPASGKTHNGITFAIDGNIIVANGTASANAYIDVYTFIPATSGSYTLSGSPSDGKVGKYVLYIVNTDNFDTGNGATYTLNAGVEYKVRIIVYSGHVASNLTFTPVLTYNETGRAFSTVKAELSNKVSGVKGNNIFAIPDYEGSPNGMKISIKGNRITLKGTNTTAIRLKLTHGIDVQNTEQVSWANESLSDMFEVGKQYCIVYKVYSGTLSNTIGTPARVSKSPSVSFLSVSVPKNIATAENMPKYIMLYIPINTTADVTFEPFFMEAYTQNDTFSYDIFDNVKVTSKLTPKNQYNYFTVSINTSNDDSVESVQTVNAVVTFPESYRAQGEKTPLIMYCHGRTDTVSVGDWVENDTKRKTLIESFVSGGYAVFDVDAISHPSAGAVDVGSPAIMQAYIKAWEYIKEHYNVEDKLFIYSLSFGSFVTFNMLSWYPTAIKTACLSAIRASHRSVFNRGTPYNAEIAANFSFNDSTGATYEADKMLGFDPYEDITDGKLLKSIPPIKALTSSADTLELNEAHTLISAWKAGGNYINHKEVSGLDHSNLCYLTDASLRNEVLAWFNRYR